MPQRKSIAAPESFTTFGDLLVYLRKRARLTQEELGRAVGYSRPQITLLEKNQRLPSAMTVTALFVPALDVDDAPELAQRLIDLAAAARKPRTNLPTPVNALIGREHDATKVRDYFLAPDKRLVTLIGPPGIGKTRLSLQVANDLLSDFADGIFFVPLAPITDLSLVAPTVAQTLGFPEMGNLRAEERLIAGIGQRQMLLILDNFEQIIEAAPIALELLTACPRLKLLVTSRESLRVPGEWLYPVPPLTLPDEAQSKALTVEAADRFSALRLFAERARAVRPDFSFAPDNVSSVAAICRRLDGLPLAIELIASRLRLMSPQTLLAQLDASLTLYADGMRGVPARQKTLHSAIDWSFDLLSDEEQDLLARLSICAGGCTLAAVQAIASASQLLEKVTSLVDKSLLYRTIDSGGEVRYNLLVMIREFGLDRLRERGEEAARRDRHAAYFLAVAEEADRAIHGPQQAAWMDRLEIEHANYRAALAWSIEQQQTETALRLIGALAWPWRVRGYIGELRSWFDRSRTLPGLDQYPAARVKALHGLSRAMWLSGNSADARALLYESQPLAAALGAAGRAGLAEAVDFLGMIDVLGDGDVPAARASFEQAREWYLQCGDQWGWAEATFHLGLAARRQRRLEAARGFFEQSLNRFRQLGDAWGAGRVQSSLGHMSLQQGDYTQARLMLEQALASDRILKFKQGLTDVLIDLARICWRQQRYDEAQQYCNEGLAISREYGLARDEAAANIQQGMLALHRHEYQQACSYYGESPMFYQRSGDNAGLVQCLAGLVAGLAGWGQADRAARLLGTMQAVQATLRADADVVLPEEFDQYVNLARKQLGEGRFAALQAEGRAMTVAEALQLSAIVTT